MIKQQITKRTTSEYYWENLPEYSYGLVMRVEKLFGQNPGTMLDIGYGGGQATFVLAPHFKKVLAWDMDADILDLAAGKIKRNKIKNIILEQKSEREINTLEDSSLSLVVVAQSLSSMDAQQLFQDIFPKIESGGGIAIIEGKFINPDKIFAQMLVKERDRVISKTINRYIRTPRKKIEKSLENFNKKDYTELLADAGFKNIQEEIFEEKIERNIEQTIEWIYANPLFACDKFGKKVNKFESELRSDLLRLSPSGIFKEKIRFTLITAKK